MSDFAGYDFNKATLPSIILDTAQHQQPTGYHIRRGVITNKSPLNVQFSDGTIITNVPSLPSYGAGVVGDVVRVEFDGPSPLVLESLVNSTWESAWGDFGASNHSSPGTSGIGSGGTNIIAVTFNTIAGRLYMPFVQIIMDQITTGGTQQAGVHDGTGFINQRSNFDVAAGGRRNHTPIPYPRSWGNASKTWNVQVSTSAGTATVVGECSITVLDVGAA